LQHAPFRPISEVSDGAKLGRQEHAGLAVRPFDEGPVEGERFEEVRNRESAGNLQGGVPNPTTEAIRAFVDETLAWNMNHFKPASMRKF
jgi:hypothetical protein